MSFDHLHLFHQTFPESHWVTCPSQSPEKWVGYLYTGVSTLSLPRGSETSWGRSYVKTESRQLILVSKPAMYTTTTLPGFFCLFFLIAGSQRPIWERKGVSKHLGVALPWSTRPLGHCLPIPDPSLSFAAVVLITSFSKPSPNFLARVKGRAHFWPSPPPAKE